MANKLQYFSVDIHSEELVKFREADVIGVFAEASTTQV